MRTVGLLAIAGATLGAGVNQWTAVGPEGGSVPYLTVDVRNPAVVFAGGYRQPTFKSTDGGLHWKATNFPARMVVTDPNDDARLYVATTGHGLFQSTDGGASWSDSGLPDGG